MPLNVRWFELQILLGLLDALENYLIVRSSAIVFGHIEILNPSKSQNLECNTNQRGSGKKDQLVSLFQRKMKYNLTKPIMSALKESPQK